MNTQHVDASTIDQTEYTSERNPLAAKLDAVGWGLFFIWVGTAFLMDVGPGIGLLGVGIITLGMQVVRRFFDVTLEGFWIVVGVLFIAGGVWELFSVQVPLLPILLLVAGLSLLVSVVRGKQLKCWK